MFISFATIRLLPLVEATMLSYLAPVMHALLASVLLKEHLTERRIGGVALGLAVAAAFCLPLAGLCQMAPDWVWGLILSLILSGAFVALPARPR